MSQKKALDHIYGVKKIFNVVNVCNVMDYEIFFWIYFPVNFEHGEVDPDAFETFKAKLRIGLPEMHAKENQFQSEQPEAPILKLAVKSDHMTYHSTAKSLTRGSGARYDPYYSTYIGVRDKTDGSLKLYEIETMNVGAKVKCLETQNPVLLQAKFEKEQIFENESKDKDQLTKEKKLREAAAKKHLVTEFGQKKGKRIYAQADRMQVRIAICTVEDFGKNLIHHVFCQKSRI